MHNPNHFSVNTTIECKIFANKGINPKILTKFWQYFENYHKKRLGRYIGPNLNNNSLYSFSIYFIRNTSCINTRWHFNNRNTLILSSSLWIKSSTWCMRYQIHSNNPCDANFQCGEHCWDIISLRNSPNAVHCNNEKFSRICFFCCVCVCVWVCSQTSRMI